MADDGQSHALGGNRKVLILLTLGLLVFLGLVYIYSANGGTGLLIQQNAQRPKSCTTVNNTQYCIPDAVFQYLPPYPYGMDVVRTRIDASLYPIMENFAAVSSLCQQWNSDYTQCLKFLSDENYYLQPNFFYTTWEASGAPYYYGLGEPWYTYTYIGVSGVGAFPNAVIAKPTTDSPIKPGMDLRTVTYFYTGWEIKNYQGMTLAVEYPKSGSTAVGTIQVEQDPNVVKNYFTVSVTPNEFILGRTFPVFETVNGCVPIGSVQPPCQDWVKKVVVTIHVNANTPPGTYLIAVNPVAPSKDSQTKWSNIYGFRYYNYGGFGVEPPLYQIFVTVS